MMSFTPSRAVPLLFVVIWSTGFIVARLIAGTVEPLTFLTLRFVFAGSLVAGVALALRARWPRSWPGWRNAAISGLLLQAGYLGCVFWAVAHGLPAAISALIAGAQPLLTALLAVPLLGETVSGRRWLGVGLGLLGLALVIAPRLGPSDSLSLVPVMVATLGTVSITLGTVWQKRMGGGLELAPNLAIQYGASAPVALAGALLTEHGRIAFTPPFWIGLGWAVLGLSLGAVGLFLWMLRRGAVVGVASLLFLVPPVTALFGFALFGDTLGPVQLLGMAVAAGGVALASGGR